MPLVVGMSAAVIAIRRVCPKTEVVAAMLIKNAAITAPTAVLLVSRHLDV
jgi:hypothetical protein